MTGTKDRLIGLLSHKQQYGIATEEPPEAIYTIENHQVADYLLANGVIVPPCKVGDMVFWSTTSVDENCEEIPEIEIGEVVSFSLQEEGLWAYCRYESGLTYWHLVADYFGKTVFLTKEEAEKALKEREGNG